MIIIHACSFYPKHLRFTELGRALNGMLLLKTWGRRICLLHCLTTLFVQQVGIFRIRLWASTVPSLPATTVSWSLYSIHRAEQSRAERCVASDPSAHLLSCVKSWAGTDQLAASRPCSYAI